MTNAYSPPRNPQPPMWDWRQAGAIVAVSFGTALVVIDGGIANVALPTIARDLRVDNSAAVLIVTVYQLVLVMSLLPFSALGDRIGIRRLYQYGQMLFTVATLLCFFAESLPFLLVVRAVQGLGAAMALSVTSALVRSIYAPQHLGRGLGLNGVIVSSSAALAPTLGGLVLSEASWPWVFAAGVPFALVSLALGRALPRSEPRDAPYDLLAALLCAATFGLTILGLESAVHGQSPVVSAAIVAAGLAIGVAFVRHETSRASPIMPIDLLRQPVFALSTVGALAAFIGSMTLLLSLPFRLQHAFGYSPAVTGAMISPWPLTTLFVAPVAGALSDRIPAGLLGGVGMALATTALVLLAFLPAHPTHFDIAWRMSMCGAGFGLFLSPNARLIVGSAPRERATAAGGLVATTRLVGQTLGATMVAMLLAVDLGTTMTPPLVAAGLTVIAGICSFARLNPAIRKPLLHHMVDVRSS